MLNNNSNTNNTNNLTTMSTGSSASNSSAGSTGAPMSLAAANVVRGIMEKVLSTPPMGAGLNIGLPNPSASTTRFFNDLDYLSSPGLDSDFGDTSPLLCAPNTTHASSSSNLSNQYFRLPLNPHLHSNKDTMHSAFNSTSSHSNFLSR